ncbi:MAG: serine/threonine protein kinase [Actinobacteria bacterium]|nr:serine/threonine protein kinase [Actinomycetota bacterium]
MSHPTPPRGTAGPDLPPGTPATLSGRYVLDGILGSGGMGLVYQAKDGVLGRQVAVKVLADNLALDPEARERFSREARAAARLTHPNVVQVFDVGEEAGRPYFVMELVPGASLADALRDHGPLAAREVEDIAAHALRGLARAHAAGVLHRDLKPGNLLRNQAGVVKVTDFGVAQAAELPGMTRTGLVLGTLPYLAPERLAGAPATVASDLYGLGATLLELLTGTSPDDGGAGAGGTPWQQLDTVPPALSGLIRTCLSPDPADRPASADEALAILEGDLPLPAAPRGSTPATEELPVEGHAPTLAHGHPGAVGHPQPLRARGWVRWAVAAGAAVLLLTALTSLAQRDPRAATVDDPAPGEAEGAGEGVPPGDTPEETARNLAEWLRSRGR